MRLALLALTIASFVAVCSRAEVCSYQCSRGVDACWLPACVRAGTRESAFVLALLTLPPGLTPLITRDCGQRLSSKHIHTTSHSAGVGD